MRTIQQASFIKGFGANDYATARDLIHPAKFETISGFTAKLPFVWIFPQT